MGLSRNIAQANKFLREGKWKRKDLVGSEVFGKTLGVIGLGKVGLEVSRRMKAFGMKIIAFDPVINENVCRNSKIYNVSLEKVWKKSDYITIHTPLIPATKRKFNHELMIKRIYHYLINS